MSYQVKYGIYIVKQTTNIQDQHQQPHSHNILPVVNNNKYRKEEIDRQQRQRKGKGDTTGK